MRSDMDEPIPDDVCLMHDDYECYADCDECLFLFGNYKRIHAKYSYK